MEKTIKVNEGTLQKGGNNGTPVNKPPENLRPAPKSTKK